MTELTFMSNCQVKLSCPANESKILYQEVCACVTNESFVCNFKSISELIQ